ncbi:MAG: AAA family ATPase, partial [Spirochaetales bacterium]|nr:AAA family ATPase [Spirochaetales bacterium]
KEQYMNNKSNTMVLDHELYDEFFSIVCTQEEGKNTSQSKAARALGYSSGVISAYKAKTYTGNVKALEEKIRSWLKREARRSKRITVPVINTHALRQIRKAISIAHEETDIAVIIGDAGTGKTTALKQYQAESHSAYLIEVDPSFTKNVLITDIARAIGIESKGTMNQIVSRIISALYNRDAVIIIDEADYLSDTALELIRRISDKSRTGVVLVGLPRLEYKLRNLRNDHEQLTSRVGVMLKVNHMTKNDAKKILTTIWEDISKEAINTFSAIAKGSVRTLSKLIERVHRVITINNLKSPTAEAVEMSSELLMK